MVVGFKFGGKYEFCTHLGCELQWHDRSTEGTKNGQIWVGITRWLLGVGQISVGVATRVFGSR